jgi:hypothetical protein
MLGNDHPELIWNTVVITSRCSTLWFFNQKIKLYSNLWKTLPFMWKNCRLMWKTILELIKLSCDYFRFSGIILIKNYDGL